LVLDWKQGRESPEDYAQAEDQLPEVTFEHG
jgi:hypothetical protein